MSEVQYEELRSRSFAIAYRMLGSVADAEDVVQDALMRVHATQSAGETIASPVAFTVTVTTRLAIDRLRSARARRETYTGTWLPEPIITDTMDAERGVELADSLSVAFLVLLESLSPEQRAAFLLRDAFDYSYAEIAELIGTSEANARQLATRARRHVAERRPRFETAPGHREALVVGFLAAARDGDLAALEAILAEDVVLHGDGGGRAPAITRPVHGRNAVARMLIAWARTTTTGGAAMRAVAVNGQPGLMTTDSAGRVVAVMALDIADGRIASVSSVVNPDKLGHIGEVGDLRALLRRR